MKRFITGFLSGAVLFTAVGSLATGIWDKIDVLKNDIKVVVNGNDVKADNFLYNDTTYLPLRAVSNAFGVAVNYDEVSNTAYIGERKDEVMIISKYIPSEDIKGWCEVKDGIYYIEGNYAYGIVAGMGYLSEYRIAKDEDTGEMVISKNNVELGRWEIIMIDGWSYVPYDTFVDEIEPLLK